MHDDQRLNMGCASVCGEPTALWRDSALGMWNVKSTHGDWQYMPTTQAEVETSAFAVPAIKTQALRTS